MTRIRIDREPPPKRPKRDTNAVALYAEQHQTCEICGGADCGNVELQTHHLAGGSGRYDCWENLLRAGYMPCHRRCENERVVYGGMVYEPISLADQVAIKLRRTQEVIEQCLGRKL